MFSSLFVCLLATLRKNFRTDLHEIFRDGWITVWIQGLFSGFVTAGRYGKWYQPTEQRDAAVLGMQYSRHHRSNYDVITSSALGGCMHCPSASLVSDIADDVYLREGGSLFEDLVQVKMNKPL